MSAPVARVTAHRFCAFLKNLGGKQNRIFNVALQKQSFHKYASNYSINQRHLRGKWLKFGAICSGSVVAAFLATKTLHHGKFSLFPEVHAITTTDGDSPRKQFNFIADIVEKIAPAVVHIEIQGRFVHFLGHKFLGSQPFYHTGFSSF